MRSRRPRSPRAALVLATALTALAPATAGAADRTRTVTGGPVAVTASSPTASGDDGGVRLTIARDGRELFSGSPRGSGCTFEGRNSCVLPQWDEDASSVVVRDLDGDDEPEVLVTQFTGGAHCCISATVLRLQRDAAGAATGYRQWVRATQSEGFTLRVLGGRPVLVTGDVRFEDRWTAHVESLVPVVVLRFAGERGFVDVTGEHLDLVRRQRAEARRILTRMFRTREADARGAAGAWAADGYRLGLRTSTLRTLRSWADRRRLVPARRGGTVASNRAFVRSLDRTLRRYGYR
jgi:hypothetical protein